MEYTRTMAMRLRSSAGGQTGEQISENLEPGIARGLREYLQLLRVFQSFSVVASSLGKGAVLIMPAGNDSLPNSRVPVTSPLSVAQGVISVGAVEETQDGYRVTSYSNSSPTLCAPGADLPSAAQGGGLTPMSGTSTACAHAAGIAALWWECLRSRNPRTEVTSRMVADEMLKAVRTDVFAPEVEGDERGAGLVQAPLGA
jgi:subtilisin family serine protease